MRDLLSDLTPAALGPAMRARLGGHRALTNARAAATELASRRVEREEAELFLAGLPDRRGGRDTA